MFGAFAPMPIRLTSKTAEECWSAEQHARACADLVAALRASALAVLTVTVSGASAEMVAYHGQNGVGLAHAPTVVRTGTGTTQVTFAPAYPSPLDVPGKRELSHAWFVRIARADPLTSSADSAVATVDSSGTVTVRTYDSANALVDRAFVLEVHGDWLPEPTIASYGGDIGKENNTTEATAPYAASVYRELQGMRGSAYTTERTSLVHAENLALARFLSYFNFRLPEKVRANSVPSRSDERLSYWQDVLGIAALIGEEKPQIRKRCSAAFRCVLGNAYPIVDAMLRELLGPIYVGLELSHPATLSTPPESTFWPPNPGPGPLDLGGGVWMSARSYVGVRVQQPSDMSDAAFTQLMSVKVYGLLDSLLPAWVTWDWSTNDALGFYLEDPVFGTGSRLDFDRL